MGGADGTQEPPFHLLLSEDEVPVARTALNLLVADETHEPPIRTLAREALTALETSPNEYGSVAVPLSPQQMKVTHTALSLLHDDLRYEHADEREVLRRIIDKLPDEHTMRAISID
jgi:capsular polysaccharide biosynthesis protein